MKNIKTFKLLGMGVLSQLFVVFLTLQVQAVEVLTDHMDLVNNIQKTDQAGLGLKVGVLSGFVFEYWYSEAQTLNLSVTTAPGNVAVGFNHNWMFRHAFANSELLSESLVPYMGAGILLGFGHQLDYLGQQGVSSAVALQVPLGVEFMPPKERFSLFGEIAPSVSMSSSIIGFLTFDIGARMYF